MEVKNDFIPSDEIIPECEVFHESDVDPDLKNRLCLKNPGHTKFIAVSDLTLDHLPTEWQKPEIMKFIQYTSDMTVKICVSYVSPNRPATRPKSGMPHPHEKYKGSDKIKRYGTGLMSTHVVTIYDSPCPCGICKNSMRPEMEFMVIQVHTATHVVYDNLEAVNTVCECNYNFGDKKGVIYLYGVFFSSDEWNKVQRTVSDTCQITCVTHDSNVMKRLPRYEPSFELPRNDFGFIVSHPHGYHKTISFGKISRVNIVPTSSHYAVKLRLRLRDKVPDNGCTFSKTGSRYEQGGVFKEDEVTLNLENSKSPLEMTPETKYVLQMRDPMMLITTYRYPSILQIVKTESKDGCWYRFSNNITIKCKDGRFVDLPSGVEITWNGIEADLKDRAIESNCVYDIPTCPGSSGAAIRYINTSHYAYCFCHDTHLSHTPSDKTNVGSAIYLTFEINS